MDINKIEIDFPFNVEIPHEIQIALDKVIKKICDLNVPEGHVMWPAASGYKPTYIPMTREEEEEQGMEFDMSIYHIEVFERKAHPREKQ